MTLVLVENTLGQREYWLTLDEAVQTLRKNRTKGVDPLCSRKILEKIASRQDHYREHLDELDPVTRAHFEFNLNFLKIVESKPKRKEKDIPYIASSILEAALIERLPLVDEIPKRNIRAFEKAEIVGLYDANGSVINPQEGHTYQGSLSFVKCFGKRELLIPSQKKLNLSLYCEYLTEPNKGFRGRVRATSIFRYIPFK